MKILTTLERPPLALASVHDDIEVDTVSRATFSRPGLARHLLGRAGDYDAVVLDGSVGLRHAYIDLLVTGLLAHRRSVQPIIVADSTWKRGTWWLDRLACRAGIAAIDSPRVTYCVLSTLERDLFPHTWGVDSARVHCTPWCYTLTDEELDAPTSWGGGVFAGGNSMRDHGPLLRVAARLPADFTLAANSPSEPIPPNVRSGTVTHARFVELMRGADVVVVALEPGIERSAGQQTYLNAMALGKPVIVTDGPGTRDYIEDGRTGLIVPPGDDRALEEALRRILDPANREETENLARRGKEAACSKFRPVDYARSVVDVALGALEETRSGRGGRS